MSKKDNFLCDHTGKRSSMRLMSVMFAIVSCVIALILAASIYYDQGDNHMVGVYLSVVFLLAATAPKALQKYIELVFGDKLPTPDVDKS